MSQQLHPFVNPDISQLGLIKASLQTKEISWHGYVTKKVLLAEYLYILWILNEIIHPNRENRHLLFITENYAALDILSYYLQDQQEKSSDCTEVATLKPWEMEPYVLYGSSFPKDKEYSQVSTTLD